MSWTPLGPPLPPPLPVPPPMPVAFSGSRGEFFRLARRGAGLEFVTLGFYRFWLLTDIRRHLWANTVVDGDAAEYTGRGKELLIGFLVALAILMPIYLGYFLIGLEAERLKAFASIPLIAFFYLFGQFAIYRARRYRLTRTVWRGVRFWMTGSGWIYALRASLWGLLTVVTLGLALPWRTAALERYKMRHSYYGDLQGSFEGRGWGFLQARLVAVAGRHSYADCAVCYSSTRQMVSGPSAAGQNCFWRCTPHTDRCALSLWYFQSHRMALVALGHPVRRRASGIVVAEERLDRAVLESDRLDGPARAGLLGLSGPVHGDGRQHRAVRD